MNTHVIIPWNGAQNRAHLLDWVIARWGEEFPDWDISFGQLDESGDWCKADAVEVGIQRSGAGQDDILIIADADVWLDPDDIAAAVGPVAHAEVAWAMPHRLVHRLSEHATRAVIVDNFPIDSAIVTYGHDRQPYVGTVGGGMTILTRAAYHECPLDPRFVGWGQEDESWGDALRTILGHRYRGSADLYHLWHPPLPRMAPGVGNIQGKHLRRRYELYNGDPGRMRQLIDSGREHLIAL